LLRSLSPCDELGPLYVQQRVGKTDPYVHVAIYSLVAVESTNGPLNTGASLSVVVVPALTGREN
jgi:hypothetical protein